MSGELAFKTSVVDQSGQHWSGHHSDARTGSHMLRAQAYNDRQQESIPPKKQSIPVPQVMAGLNLFFCSPLVAEKQKSKVCSLGFRSLVCITEGCSASSVRALRVCVSVRGNTVLNSEWCAPVVRHRPLFVISDRTQHRSYSVLLFRNITHNI